MKRILTAAVLVPIVLAMVFLPPRWEPLFVAATAIVAAMAAWEYLGLAQRMGSTPPRAIVCMAVVALFAATWQWPDQTTAILGMLSLVLLLVCTFGSSIERVLPDAAASVFGLLYAGFTLISLPALRMQSNGPSLVVFLFCAVWAGDIAALYVGRAWGRHKLAPSISPNKSWEGSVASVAGSVLVVAGLLWLAEGLQAHLNTVVLSYSEDPWWYWLGLTVLLNVAAQVGDLAESALKRSAGVKDSGAILPGHGGVLDRIDALLLAAPTLWYAQLIHHSF
ncbi:MAG TPA: phosphatidate cytidylyltransferase [Candidatus Saccharimonadales bacterium]|nr:phosphatidate cytidylyltransferase [Candidatus Saccharimonadales bacterium]